MLFVKDLLNELINTLKSRDVIILLLLGPIALTLIFGGAYMKTYVENIPIALLDEDNSSLSRSVLQQFAENERFRAVYTVKSTEEMEALMDAREIFMGVCIPEGFHRNIMKGEGSQVLIIVDGTNIVVGNNAYASASTIIQTVAAGASIKRLEAKGMLEAMAKSAANPFMFTDRMLFNPKLSYNNYLLLGYLAVLLQQVMLSGVGIQMIRYGTEIAESHTLRSILLKILACIFYALLSVALAIGAASFIFKVDIRGSVPLAMLYCLLYAFAISGPAILLASLLKDKLKYIQLSYMLSLPTFISCGYVWPQDQMPQVLVAVLKCIWPLIYFARPFDELLFKGVLPVHAAGGLILYTLFWLPASILVFRYRYGSRRKSANLSEESVVLP